MWNGYKFLEKMKHHIFLKSDIWTDICCFYRTFTFLIDKTDSFQELCSSPHLTQLPPSKILVGLPSHSLHPKYRKDYQVTVQSLPPSKIPEGLPGHSPVDAFLQNTRGITRSVQLLPPSQIPEGLPGQFPSKISEGLPGQSSRPVLPKYLKDYQVSPVDASFQYTGGITRSQSSRRLPPKYSRDYQVSLVATSLQNTGGITR